MYIGEKFNNNLIDTLDNYQSGVCFPKAPLAMIVSSTELNC